MSSFVVGALLTVSAASTAVSYPESCQWIGVDGMHGPYLPVGVCKHIFNPNDLADVTDDHRYSQKYECSEDGSVVNHVWQNSSFCEGDPDYIAPAKVQGEEGDYYSCDTKRACPYAVIRFYDQLNASDPDSCAKSGDGWYSEAPMTVYQCLNVSDEWYMLQCTEDGKGVISIEYNENCERVLNVSMAVTGCDFKDRFIEIMHCDYWDGVEVLDVTTTTTTLPPIFSTDSETTSTTSTQSTLRPAADVKLELQSEYDLQCQPNHNMGTFTNAEQCASAAVMTEECGTENGVSILWDDYYSVYEPTWGCRCCQSGATLGEHHIWTMMTFEVEVIPVAPSTSRFVVDDIVESTETVDTEIDPADPDSLEKEPCDGRGHHGHHHHHHHDGEGGHHHHGFLHFHLLHPGTILMVAMCCCLWCLSVFCCTKRRRRRQRRRIEVMTKEIVGGSETQREGNETDEVRMEVDVQPRSAVKEDVATMLLTEGQPETIR